MKYINSSLLVILVLLQVRLWLGDGSFVQVMGLRKEVSRQEQKTEKLKERNSTLDAEVHDLKYRLDALEERARTDLGMVRRGETFCQINTEKEKG